MPTPTTTPNIGYNPSQGAVQGTQAPGNLEQWYNDFAMTFADQYANGTLAAGSGSLFDNSVYQNLMGAGAPLLDPGGFGNGKTGQNTYNILYQYAKQVAAKWDQIPPSARTGLSSPVGLQTGAAPGANGQPSGATLDPTDRTNIAAATSKAADRDTQLAITALQEQGMDRRAAAELVSRMSIAQIQETGANTRAAQDIASRERVATADRTSRETIAGADRAENARQFDANLKQQRLSLAADLSFKLLDRGVELMKNPVDWVAYQYYLQKMDIPLNALTLSSAAAVMGAIPPTGPSAAGPVIGGPAVVDGDTSHAQQLGITNAGPVSIAQAVSYNPGGQVMPISAGSSAQATVQANGGTQQLDAALAQARTTELPAALGQDHAFAQQAVQQAQQIISEHRTQMLSEAAAQQQQPQPFGAPPAIQGGPEGGQQPAPQSGSFGQPPPIGGGLQPQPIAAQPMPGMQTQPIAAQSTPQGQLPGGGIAAPAPPQGPLTAPVPNQQLPGAQPGMVGGPFTGTEGQVAPPAPVPPAPAGSTAQGGSPLTPAISAAQPTQGALTPAVSGAQAASGGGNPAIMQILQALANATGLSLDQIQQLFPANLMTPQYGNDVINNAPIIKSLQGSGNQPLSGFYTGAPGTGLNTIKATGTDIGVRGGQDYNATSFLTATPGQQGLLQGAVQGAGQYWPDFMQQMLRASPVSNLDVGSQGQRRYQ